MGGGAALGISRPSRPDSSASLVASRPTTEKPGWQRTGGATGRLLAATYGWKSSNGVGTVACEREIAGAKMDEGADVGGGCSSRDVDDDDDDVTDSPVYVTRGPAAVT